MSTGLQSGHANVTTTGRYDRHPEQVKQQTAQKLHFPYRSPLHAEAKCASGKRKTFPTDQFHYDPDQNVYICPQGEVLRFWTNDYHSQRVIYKAPDRVCAACVVKAQCTTGKSGRRVGHSLFKALLDRVQAYQQLAAYQKAMRKRQVWIEPKFAEVKQWHQGEKFRLRGIFKVNIEALLWAAGQNIKQLLKAKSPRNRPKPPTVMAGIPRFSSYNLS